MWMFMESIQMIVHDIPLLLNLFIFPLEPAPSLKVLILVNTYMK